MPRYTCVCVSMYVCIYICIYIQNFILEQAMKAIGRVEVQFYSLFNFGARWGWQVNATSRPLYPRERGPVPIVQEAGWATGSVWTGAENV